MVKGGEKEAFYFQVLFEVYQVVQGLGHKAVYLLPLPILSLPRVGDVLPQSYSYRQESSERLDDLSRALQH